MDSGALRLALALLLIIKGLPPLVSPMACRRMFEHILGLSNGQIQFFGLCSIAMVFIGMAMLA